MSEHSVTSNLINSFAWWCACDSVMREMGFSYIQSALIHHTNKHDIKRVRILFYNSNSRMMKLLTYSRCKHTTSNACPIVLFESTRFLSKTLFYWLQINKLIVVEKIWCGEICSVLQLWHNNYDINTIITVILWIHAFYNSGSSNS